MTQITKPGLYPDISNEDYHADPCPEPSLSSSLAKLIVNKTPAHAKLAHPKLNPDYEPTVSNQFDLGSVAHAMMLHDDRDIVVLDYDAYRSKAAKADRDEARAKGKIPILAAQYETACAMVRAGRAQLDQHEEAWEAFRKGYGQPEQTLIWRDGPENAPIWCRMRLDWKPNNGNVFWDYKTTAARPARRIGFGQCSVPVAMCNPGFIGGASQKDLALKIRISALSCRKPNHPMPWRFTNSTLFSTTLHSARPMLRSRRGHGA